MKNNFNDLTDLLDEMNQKYEKEDPEEDIVDLNYLLQSKEASPQEEIRAPSVKSVSAKKDHYSMQKSTGKGPKPIKTYQNLDEDPMLMLERDNSNEALRLGGSSRKEERKKGFNQRKMTYQQPLPELQQMEDSFQTMPDDLEQMD